MMYYLTPLVAAGVIAKKILSETSIQAKVVEVGGEKDIDSALNRAIATQDSVPKIACGFRMRKASILGPASIVHMP